MTKKLFFSLLALVLVTLPLFTDCAQPAQTWDLKFWTMEPETNPQVPDWLKFFQCINEKTGGRVTVTPFYSSSLADPKDVISGLQSGLIDFAFYSPSMAPGQFPVTCVNDLPFLFSTPKSTLMAARAWVDEGLAPEFTTQGFVRVCGSGAAPMYFFLKEKQVSKMEDFKGLKIRVPGGATMPAIVEALGGTPTSIVLPDVYMSLERGVVDGMVTVGTLVKAWKFYDVVEYFLNVPVDYGAGFFAISQVTWDSFPKNIQKAILKCGEEYEGYSLESTMKQVAATAQDLEAAGMTVYTISPEELERWKQATAPVIDSYIAELNKRGLDGDRIIAIAREMSEKYK
jgi:TRAP-type C4-dicarboxylate transport system substrate-binding protein